MKKTKIENLARSAKALSHPARVKILQDLAKANKCTCGQIVDRHALAQSTISQHLKELKSAGFIQGIIDGISTCYCLNPDKIKEIINEFSELFNQINKLESKK